MTDLKPENPGFWEIRQGNCLELLRAMPDGIVQTCVTSPPYWGLRDYGTANWEGGKNGCDHQKATKVGLASTGSECGKCGARRVDSQLGLEPTPEAYVSRMVEVFREVRRVLREDGTLWLNLGDSYTSATKGNGGWSAKQVSNAGSFHSGSQRLIPDTKPKDLCGIPWRVAFALQADGWWLRSDIVWSKPNPMPESVTDRPTKAHEYLFLLAKSERYYYDAKAIMEASIDAPGMSRGGSMSRFGRDEQLISANAHRGQAEYASNGTRNRRTVWTVTSEPFPEAHFAVMPQALVEPCVLAGSKPGDLVLDPFAGSGTVGVVALRHGRRCLGLELNPAYCTMARYRIAGPLFAWADAIKD
jgi:DNA modification methylase